MPGGVASAAPLLSWRRVLLAARLGVALLLPTLRGGFLMDDWVHQLALRRDPRMPVAPDQLYGFRRGDVADTAAGIRAAVFPWWTAPDLKLWFWRPWSSALLQLDHAWAGDHALGYHLHSLLWLGGSLVVAGAILRRLLPARAAGPACLLLALMPGHAVTAGWIANRNALVALLPALLAFWAHLRWRVDHWRPGAVLAPALLAVALLGAEAALGMVPYFVAYEALGRAGEAPFRRVRALLPAGAVVALYLVAYAAMGCGARGSGFYLDPATDPTGFLAGAAQRIPVLLAGALLLVPPELWFLLPASRPVLAGLGALAALVLGLTAWRACRPASGWLWGAALLALVPVAATVPAFRLLAFAGLGTAALLGTLVAAARAPGAPRGRRALGWGLVLLHGVGAPVLSLLFQAGLAQQARDGAAVAAAVAPDAVAPDTVADRHVVLVNAPDFLTGGHIPLLWRLAGWPWPASWRALAMTPHDLRLECRDAHTLVLTVVDGVLLDSDFEQVYRDRRTRPLTAGLRVDAGELTVEVLAVRDGGATTVAFHAARELSAARWCWLVWQDRQLRRLELPAPGHAVVLRWSPGPGTPGY